MSLGLCVGCSNCDPFGAPNGIITNPHSTSAYGLSGPIVMTQLVQFGAEFHTVHRRAPTHPGVHLASVSWLAVPAGHSAKGNNLESNCGYKSQETSQTFRILFQISVSVNFLC